MTITHVSVFKRIPFQTSAQVSNFGRHRRLCHLSSLHSLLTVSDTRQLEQSMLGTQHRMLRTLKNAFDSN